MSRKIVIGIDGGGTTTRVLASDFEGNILGHVEGGMARLDRNQEAVHNVREAVIEVVQGSDRNLSDVAYIVAGIAGLESPNDQKWAKLLTEISELNCPQKYVNDAVIAHVGAFLSKPGIIAISGTGSVVFGVTESNRHIRNYDMQHYANSGARHLAYAALFLILAGDYTVHDEPLIQQVFAHWKVNNLENLRDILTREGQGFTRMNWDHVGKLAPIITEAAFNGIPIARQVCDQAANELSIGIRLVGSHFCKETVDVALIGSVIRSKYLRLSIEKLLQKDYANKIYHVQEPTFSSQAGAILMALAEVDIPLNDGVLTNIGRHPKSTLDNDKKF